jgi:uncharacterized protein YqgQ
MCAEGKVAVITVRLYENRTVSIELSEITQYQIFNKTDIIRVT